MLDYRDLQSRIIFAPVLCNSKLRLLAIRNELAAVLDELKRIEAGAAVHDDLLDRIDQINITLYGMKERKNGL